MKPLHVLSVSACFLFLLLTGCGTGAVNHSVAPTATRFEGRLLGGENPITYGMIRFWETNNTGVATAISTQGNGIYLPGTASTLLGTTYTDASGMFSFSPALACSDANDYVYATAAGGNPGNNDINNNILLMAAVGNCSSFGASTYVNINELTTVAAAYALSAFTSMTGSYTTSLGQTFGAFFSTYSNGNTTYTTNQGSGNVLMSPGQIIVFASNCQNPGNHVVVANSQHSLTVQGNYPEPGPACNWNARNVASSPAISVVSSAANYLGTLSNGTYSPDATHLNGLANAFSNAANLVDNYGHPTVNSPSNPAAVMPFTTITTLGNILQACVNSTGGTASDTSTPCGKLFSYATLTTTTSGGTTTNTPTNTLQAILNIAHAPTQNVSNLYNIIPSQPAFQPYLSAAPSDFSLAIAYPETTGGTNGYTSCSSSGSATSNGLCSTYFLTVDYAGNLYVNNLQKGFQGQNIVSFTAAGANRFATAINTGGTPGTPAADNLGNVFYPYDASHIAELPGAVSSLNQTPTLLSSGTDLPASVAVDTANNVYVGANGYGGRNVLKFPASQLSAPILLGTNSANTSATSLTLDTYGNLWASLSGSNAPATLAVLAGATSLNTATAETNTTVTVYPANLSFDSKGVGWTASYSDINTITPTGSGTAVTDATQSLVASLPGPAVPVHDAMDGNNNFFISNQINNNIYMLPTLPSTYTPQIISPCVAGTSATCPALAYGYNGILYSFDVRPDSAGSLWVSSSSGSLLQIIGIAAPTWPLSALKPGVMP